MTLAECMKVLELPPSATPEEVRYAYHRLAHQLHPDKHTGHPHARERFIRVAEAYRMLRRASRAVEAGERVGTCGICRSFGTVLRNADGQVVCPGCALGNRRRFLPLPVLVVVKCTVPLALLILAACLLFSAMQTPSMRTAAGALAAALGSMVSLAVVCLRVRHCLPPSPSSRWRNTPRAHRST